MRTKIVFYLSIYYYLINFINWNSIWQLLPNSNSRRIKGKNPLLINVFYISMTYVIIATKVHCLIPILILGIIYAILAGKLEKSKPLEKVGRKATILNPGIPGDGIRAAEQEQYLLEGCGWPLGKLNKGGPQNKKTIFKYNYFVSSLFFSISSERLCSWGKAGLGSTGCCHRRGWIYGPLRNGFS